MPRQWPKCDFCGSKLPRHPTAASWELVSECRNERCPKRRREQRLLRNNRLIFLLSIAMAAFNLALYLSVGGPLKWFNMLTVGFILGLTAGTFVLGPLYLFD